MDAPNWRINVVSPDAAFGERLASALKPVGTVELHEKLDSLAGCDPIRGLHVVHVDGALADAPLDRLGECRVIVVVPRASVERAIAAMQASPHVVGVIAADALDTRELCAMARRVVSGDLFGVDKVMGGGTQVRTQQVHDHEDKVVCLAHVLELARDHQVSRRYHDMIEQCLDEMLMNALYDAPVDAHGKRPFAGISARDRVPLSIEQRVDVQYACYGKRFAIAVRDAFGSLTRDTFLAVIDKSLHSSQPVDRRASGAGLGLYLMLTSARAVYFQVVPGKGTEVTCVFDLEARTAGLAQLGFFVEHRDVAGVLPARTPRKLHPVDRRKQAAARRRRNLALGVLAIAGLATGAVFAWPTLFPGPTTVVAVRTVPPGAAVEIEGRSVGVATLGAASTRLAVDHDYRVIARLDGYRPRHATIHPTHDDRAITLELERVNTVVLETEPAGATAIVDGTPVGTTPIAVTSLDPGITANVVFERPGYRPATTTVKTPAPGGSTRVVQRLEPSDDHVLVRVISDPPGALVIRDGEPPGKRPTRTFTPAEIFVEAGRPHRFTLTMPGHAPLEIGPFTPPRGAGTIEKRASLEPK